MKKWFVAMPLIVALAACGPVQLTNEQLLVSKDAARTFADNLNAGFVSCSTQDSEPDGYVSCTLNDKASGKLVEILCSYQSTVAGCKPKS